VSATSFDRELKPKVEQADRTGQPASFCEGSGYAELFTQSYCRLRKISLGAASGLARVGSQMNSLCLSRKHTF
jgi:hypothetical protein